MNRAGLPLERSSFIGRRRDLQRLQDLVERHGLVTIAGPPGIGKTRIAGRLDCKPAAFLEL